AAKPLRKSRAPLEVRGGAGIEIGFLLSEDDLFYEIGEGVFGTFLLSKKYKSTRDEKTLTLEKPIVEILQDMPVYSNRNEYIGIVRYVVASEDVLDSFIIEQVEEPVQDTDVAVEEEDFRDEKELPEEGNLTEQTSSEERSSGAEKKEAKETRDINDQNKQNPTTTQSSTESNTDNADEDGEVITDTTPHGELITLLLEDIWKVEASRIVLQKTREEVMFHQKKHGIGEHIMHFIKEHFG
ncbi:MAG: hypothetical protein QW728_04510, partial [Thermoplasmata archaeon]